MEKLIGENIGPYHIQALLARTGIAMPFKALEARNARSVVLKILPPYHAQRPDFIQQFRRQVEMLTSLTHSHLVSLLDCGQVRGMTYLALPYIPGGTLQDRLRSPLSISETLRLFTPLAEALEYLYTHDVVHQAIKPNNILLTSPDRALLSDYGFPTLLAGSAALRGAATAVGDPLYMAPEQVMGQAVTPRTDVYALGIVIYRCLTGRLPFQGEVPLAISLQQLYDEAPLPSQVTPFIPAGSALEKALLQALAKKSADRFGSPRAFLAALSAATTNDASSVGSQLPTQDRPSGEVAAHQPLDSWDVSAHPSPLATANAPASVELVQPAAPVSKAARQDAEASDPGRGKYEAAELVKTDSLHLENQADPIKVLPRPGADFVATSTLRNPSAEVAPDQVLCFRCDGANPARRTYCIYCGYNMTSKQAEQDTVLGPEGQPLRARLFLNKAGLLGRELLLHQNVTTIGRVSSNDIVLLDATVSRRHAQLSFTGMGWQLEDAGSVNGTFVNGRRLVQPLLLHHGDLIQFGEQEATFRLGGRRGQTPFPK